MKLKIICFLGSAVLLLITACSCGYEITERVHDDPETLLPEVIETPGSDDAESPLEIQIHEDSVPDELQERTSLSSFSTEQVHWKLDASVHGIVISRSDGTEAVYPLTEEAIQAASQFYDEEYYENAIHCIADGNRIMLFVPPFAEDAVAAFSEDGGATWSECPVPDTYGTDITGACLGDIPGGGTWLVIRGPIGAGKVAHALYCKRPGEDWVSCDAFDAMEPRPLNYVTFLSERVAFISVGAGLNGRFPFLYCSTDGGKSWTKCTFLSDREDSYVGIDSIEMMDGTFKMKCSIQTEENAEPEVYVSDDGLVWVEGKVLPYTVRLNAEVSIFPGPSYDFNYDHRVVGEDGVYTIVEESIDEEDNLWGKLKSGVGWVDLTAVSEAAAQNAPMVACFADNLTFHDGLYQEYIVEDSEYTVKIAFRAKEDIHHVAFNSMQYTENDIEVSETHFTIDEIRNETYLVVGVVFYGDTTTYGISFSDSDGEEHHYIIGMSGRNGELEFHAHDM